MAGNSLLHIAHYVNYEIETE